jgi:peptidoglycan hydrolase-like protein with peptidoglycan-binding domain
MATSYPCLKKRGRSVLSLIVLSIFFIVGLDEVSAAAKENTKSTPAAKQSSQTTKSTSKAKPLPLPPSSARTLSQPSASSQAQKSKKRKGKKSTASKKGGVRGQKEIETSRVLQIQQALTAAGYYKDEPTGKWDVTTTQAMSAYQDANGFRITGKPDALSLKKLGL